MDNTPISRAEHEEFKRRMEDENNRQNHRINALEKIVDQIHALNVSVEKLAASVERMVEEQKQQGQRLTVIENRDGESWRNLVGYGLTALAGYILGLAFNHLGL